MSKRIKTTDLEVAIDITTINVVEIGMFRFEYDERFPWISVYDIGNEDRTLVAEIDDDNMPSFLGTDKESFEKMKIYCLNWYFNNVEIVKEIKK